MQPAHDNDSEFSGEDELVIEDTTTTTTDTDFSEDSDGDAYQPENLRRSQRLRGLYRGPFGPGHRHDHDNDYRANLLNRFSDNYHHLFKRSLIENMGRRRNCGGPPFGHWRGPMNHHRGPVGHQRGPHFHCRPMNYHQPHHHHYNGQGFGGYPNHPGGHWHHGARKPHGNAEHPGKCRFRKDHSRPQCQKRKQRPARDPLMNPKQRKCCFHSASSR